MVRVQTLFPHLQTNPGPHSFDGLEIDPEQMELGHLKSAQIEPKHKEPESPRESLYIVYSSVSRRFDEETRRLLPTSNPTHRRTFDRFS